MRFAYLLLALISLNAWSLDPVAYLNNFDSKVYSLKTKGIKDFVVDVESSKLTKQMNDQMIFGKVNQVIFRTYWTANPERVAIEIIGLPEGFKEIKEELKFSILSQMDNILPLTSVQRFAGYKFHTGSSAKEIVAQDSTGIAAIQTYVMKFDAQDKLTEVIGKKVVGTLTINPQYEKDAFADGKWVLKSMTTNSSENGQTLTLKKDLAYGKSQGIGVVTEVTMVTEQSFPGNPKPLISEETLEFKNYKINAGEALKYFLGDSSKLTP